MGIEVVEEPWIVQGVALCHHPQQVARSAVVAGHLHPCVRLYGAANDTVRLPCFWLRTDLLMLPAFGGFTGGAPIVREAGDRVLGGGRRPAGRDSCRFPRCLRAAAHLACGGARRRAVPPMAADDAGQGAVANPHNGRHNRSAVDVSHGSATAGGQH